MEIDCPWWWTWVIAVLLLVTVIWLTLVAGRVGQPHRGQPHRGQPHRGSVPSPPADAGSLADPPPPSVDARPPDVSPPQWQPSEASSETSHEDEEASSAQEEQVGVNDVGVGGYPAQVQHCEHPGQCKRQYNAPAKGGVRAMYRICDRCGSRWMQVGDQWEPIAPRASPHVRSPPGPEPSGAIAKTTAWTGRPAVVHTTNHAGMSSSAATRAPPCLRSRVRQASRQALRRQAATTENEF